MADRSQIIGEQRRLSAAGDTTVFIPNIEAAQPLHQFSRNLADGGMPLAPVGIQEAAKHGGRGRGQRHFEMQRKAFVVDSGHGENENKYETLSQWRSAAPAMSAERWSASAARP
ncbi:hypothetical protein [Novosphingobium mathurense]|uniref:hypothetical protein n=1 Tax=Novosphingobium mathurense TaxID=428990 RepID=UPI0009A6C5ED|nr:hypothetical protein [Novosphingobium mathurense]